METNEKQPVDLPENAFRELKPRRVQTHSFARKSLS